MCEMHREKSRLQQGIAEDAAVHTRKMNQTADGLEPERWMGWYIDRTDRQRERVLKLENFNLQERANERLR